MAVQREIEPVDRVLLEAGLVDALQLAAARRRAERVGGTVPGNLVRMGLVPETKLLDVLSRRFRIPTAGRERLASPQREAIDKIPFERAYERRMLPLRIGREGGRPVLEIAVADPAAIAELESDPILAGTEIRACVSPERDIERALELAYGKKPSPFRPNASRSVTMHKVLGDLPPLRPSAPPPAPPPPVSPAGAKPSSESAPAPVAEEKKAQAKDSDSVSSPSKEMVALRALIELLESKGVLTKDDFMSALQKLADRG
ncbi:MAG: hypothetical protein AB1405_01575 [Bdellovibrionota bacterium]